MPLNVVVKSQRPVQRPGENYRAIIELTNPDEFDAVYVVESVSIKCQGKEVLDPGWVSAAYYQSNEAQHRQDGGRVVRSVFAARAAQILERLVFLAPGQEKQFSVVCPLPEKLPPSFKGTSVRYKYDMYVGVKYRKAAYGDQGTLRKSVANQEPQSLTMQKPFYVFPDYFVANGINSKSMEGREGEEVPLLDVCFRPDDEVLLQWSEVTDDEKTSSTEGSILSKVVSESAESSSTANMAQRLGMSGSVGDTKSVSRMSVSRSSIPETELSYAPPARRRTSSLSHAEAQMLVGMCVNPEMFNLRFGDETVVLFSFNPSMARPLRPGSTLGGVLRLSGMGRNGFDPKWRCQSYTVMLETEEEVMATWRSDASQKSCVIRRLHCEHTEFTGDVFMTNFMFTIPSNAPPSFKTPLLSLRWVLKFEFEVGRCMDFMDDGETQVTASETEPLLWQLPLIVYPQ